jgi:hypothetical protein
MPSGERKDEGSLPHDYHFRTIPFNEMLYILSAGLVPKDTLDAEGFVKLQLGEKRVHQLLSIIKLQRWVRSVQAMGGEATENEDGDTTLRESLGGGNSEDGKGDATQSLEQLPVEHVPVVQVAVDRETVGRETVGRETVGRKAPLQVGEPRMPSSTVGVATPSTLSTPSTPSLSFEHVRSTGDPPPPRLPRSASAASAASAASSTTSEGSNGSAGGDNASGLPLHQRRSTSDTHPLTGLKIPTD